MGLKNLKTINLSIFIFNLIYKGLIKPILDKNYYIAFRCDSYNNKVKIWAKEIISNYFRIIKI